MTTSESDPTKGIVDIDTFGLFIIGYRAGIIDSSLSPGHSPVKTSFVGSPDSWHSELFFLTIPDYPWKDVPESLRDTIAMAYHPESLVEIDRLSIKIANEGLAFEIKTPVIVPFRDGQVQFPPTMVSLSLCRTVIAAHPKGSWMISKTLLTQPYLEMQKAYSEIEMLEKLGIDHLEDTRRFVQLQENWGRTVRTETEMVPATLNQLHDIARILVRARSNVSVYRMIM
ncbi:hypothetical protein HYT17_00030 [Candidatus Microgenomates bacterium]|nr:hypothetical protein [Candidatus Microgenomates bacterium]